MAHIWYQVLTLTGRKCRVIKVVVWQQAIALGLCWKWWGLDSALHHNSSQKTRFWKKSERPVGLILHFCVWKRLNPLCCIDIRGSNSWCVQVLDTLRVLLFNCHEWLIINRCCGHCTTNLSGRPCLSEQCWVLIKQELLLIFVRFKPCNFRPPPTHPCYDRWLSFQTVT